MSENPKGPGTLKMSKSVGSLDLGNPPTNHHESIGLLSKTVMNETRVTQLLSKAHTLYNSGRYKDALDCCDQAYEADAFRTDNLLLTGAIHFQLRNYSESIFYNQQCIRVDPNFAEGYSNLGNALKELGDLKAAVQFYQKLGQTQEAMETYQMALVLNPSLVDAHSNLGNLYKATGDFEGARRCYLEAIRIKPDFPIAWNNLAGIFKEEGQLDTAVAYYKEAIRLCPEFADAHSNLGNVLKEQNHLDDAVACYQTALRLRPDFAIAHCNLASCFYDMGNLAEAIRSFKYAIQLEPNFPDAHNNLGNALRENGRLDEAIQCYRSALRLKPDHPHAYNNLGNALKDKGFVKEAIHCYVTAVRLMPSFAAAHSNLGSIFKEQGKVDQALAHYHEAISLDPLFADAYSNLGNTYKDLGQLDEAMRCYTTAIKIKPNFADAYANLAAAYKDSGQVVLAVQHYRQALQLKPDLAEAVANLVHTLVFICDWTTREEDFARLSQVLALQLTTASTLPAIQPFHALVYPFSMTELLQLSARYAAKAKANVAIVESRYTFRPKPKSLRLKIGYVSSDFGNHPLSHLMQSVFSLHDRSKFEITCYALSPSDQSQWRHKIEMDAEHFKDISKLHSGDAAQLIHNDGIHILINLNGYTKGCKNEIFALHPSQLQVQFMGFCGTMGADYIEYIIADGTVIPPELRPYYQEKVISMPHSYFVNDHKQSSTAILEMADPPTRAKYGLPEDKFLFCNFNQLFKIDPAIFDTWMRILKRVPNSALWLLRFPPAGEENLRREARKRGVRDEQIIFTDVAPREEHLARGVLADLFLDTSCYNAHTTACDTLWAGTPLLTLREDKMASRVGASLLRACGLEELVCTSHGAYEELAVSLAEDSERLFGMRRHLEGVRTSCAAFDTARWVRNMETGLLKIWKRYEQGQSTTDIIIEDDEPVFVVKQPDLFAGGGDEDYSTEW